MTAPKPKDQGQALARCSAVVDGVVCGGEAGTWTGTQYTHVECKNCLTEIMARSPSEAVRLWNRAHAPATGHERVTAPHLTHCSFCGEETDPTRLVVGPHVSICKLCAGVAVGVSVVERFVNHKRYAGISRSRLPDGDHWCASTSCGYSYPGDSAGAVAQTALDALAKQEDRP